MAERGLAQMSDAELEAALRDLGEHLAYPPTPDASAAVVRRIRTPTQIRPSMWPRALAAGLVAAMLFALGLLAVPEVRNAVAERLGLRGVSIVHVDEVPTPGPVPTPAPPSPSAAASPSPLARLGTTLGLGDPVTLAEAARRLGSPLFLPALGEPDAVYALGQTPDTTQVSIAYAARPGLPAVPQAGGVGLLLSEFRASVDSNFLGKGIPPGAQLQEVQVAGGRAYWISGAPHLFLRAPNGSVRDLPARLAGNTLLWEKNGTTLRVESALDRDAAIAIAESVHQEP